MRKEHTTSWSKDAHCIETCTKRNWSCPGSSVKKGGLCGPVEEEAAGENPVIFGAGGAAVEQLKTMSGDSIASIISGVSHHLENHLYSYRKQQR